MDWSDPWAADNDADDNDERLPTKPTVTSPAASAPYGLSNVWDSPWGSNGDTGDTGDAGFGGWESEVGTAARVGEEESQSNAWDRIEEDVEEHKESETSDSATTIHPDDVDVDADADADAPAPATIALPPDDGLSTRPSTSPSDVSHNETATESPRTSFEDVERAQSDEKDAEIPPVPSLSTTVDADLMSQLFPPTKEAPAPKEAPDDPIHSTSETRKAWHRLTRKQTLREYKSGLHYDNYIRVTWKTSHIRSEVNRVVSRWVTEDRMAGRGPGARASFYWDTPVPKDQKTPFHPRQKSTVSVSNPAGKTVPPVATDVPAAFNWSTPATGPDPWRDDTDSTPVAPKHGAIAKLQRQEGRGGSVDLTRRPQEPASHKRNAKSVTSLKETVNTPSMSPILPPPPKGSMSEEMNPWASLDALDTNSTSKQKATTTKPEPVAEEDDDDDDDWGEMVESPALSTTQNPLPDFSEPPTRDNTLSTPATTPKSVKSSPLGAHVIPAGSKHASPIVRLKGTVSPTSARFKANAFVPAGIETGPIGPGILKRRSDSVGSTPEKSKTPPRPVAQLDEVLEGVNGNGSGSPKSKAPKNAADDFSAFETSAPPEPPTSYTPPPAPASPPPPTQDSTAAWADTADFSIFESSVPTSTAAPAPSQQPDPSDPWSFFDTPGPAPAPSEPFARPPPRPVTPPPKQPLTGATNSAQRRKMEEEEVIREIVRGLPDLRYMLR